MQILTVARESAINYPYAYVFVVNSNFFFVHFVMPFSLRLPLLFL